MKQFSKRGDFWSGMVESDFAECAANKADLRAAFHAAISLFHMNDWVWNTHELLLRSNFTYVDGVGNTVAVHDARSFANSLEQLGPWTMPQAMPPIRRYMCRERNRAGMALAQATAALGPDTREAAGTFQRNSLFSLQSVGRRDKIADARREN
jgi:hypothetical protein